MICIWVNPRIEPTFFNSRLRDFSLVVRARCTQGLAVLCEAINLSTETRKMQIQIIPSPHWKNDFTFSCIACASGLEFFSYKESFKPFKGLLRFCHFQQKTSIKNLFDVDKALSDFVTIKNRRQLRIYLTSLLPPFMGSGRKTSIKTLFHVPIDVN